MFDLLVRTTTFAKDIQRAVKLERTTALNEFLEQEEEEEREIPDNQSKFTYLSKLAEKSEAGGMYIVIHRHCAPKVGVNQSDVRE